MSAEPLHPAEVVKACLDSPSAAAWETFVRCFQPTIASGVIAVLRQRNLRPEPSLVDDLIQETYFKLCRDGCKVLRAFKWQGDNSIFAYIKVVAITCSRDHFRAHSAQKRGNELEVHGTDAEAVSSTGSMEKDLLLGEMERHLERRVESVRDRNIFWLYYRQGFNAREIAALPNVDLTAKGVESLLFRLTKLLRDTLGPTGLPEDGGAK
jgi:RNA polymerase sigma-70 factor (ECF subfamily)